MKKNRVLKFSFRFNIILKKGFMIEKILVEKKVPFPG